MSSSDSEILTPDSIKYEANNVIENLLPEISKERYLNTYNDFMKWRAEKNIKSFSESVFLTYFNGLSSKLQSSTLWSRYSMLKSTLSVKNNVNLKNFHNLISFLKRQSQGFKSRKSKVFTSQEVEFFLNDAPDEIYLAVKILPSLLLLTIISTCYGYIQITSNEPIGTLFRWKQMDYQYPNPQLRQQAINRGEFTAPNVIPLGVERWKDRLFISTPRWKKGVPATLSTVSIISATDSPVLEPYPNWDWHNAGNCTGFTSLFRMNIDHCGVMWAMDSGQIEPFGDTQNLCPPTLFAINVNTNTVMGRYPIPSEFVLQNSLISNLVVDSRDARCRDVHVYMADAWRFGLIVFRNEDKAFWRFDHYTFYPEPLLANYTLHGLNFQWTDGLFGMSLGKVYEGDRLLYYHAMSSSLEFVVKTSVIRDPTRVKNAVSEFKLLGQSRGADGQVSAAAIDRNGIMFFGLVSRDSIGCWDTRKPYLNRNLMVVAQNNNTLVFPNDLRIDHEVPQMVWIITNKLPLFLANAISPSEFNFRVMYLNPVEAVKNSQCQPHYVS